jgi:hypothetical protein
MSQKQSNNALCFPTTKALFFAGSAGNKVSKTSNLEGKPDQQGLPLMK